MSDPYFRFEIAPDHFVWVAPLDEAVLDSLAIDGLGDEFGFFVFETNGPSPLDCVGVLAKCPSYEAAMRLLDFMHPLAAKGTA